MDLLIWLVILVVFAAIILALIQYLGITIDPIVYRIAGILLVGIFVVVIIRLLWPVLVGGQLPSLR